MKPVRLSVLCVAFALAACGPKKQVTRTAAGASADLSGKWSNVDAEQVAKKMVEDCLSNPWASNFAGEHDGQKPVVKLISPILRTDDRNVNVQVFGKQVERQLLNSGKVKVVAGEGEEGGAERERTRQAKQASSETAKSHMNETGSDFVLTTVVNSQNDTDGAGKSVRAYLINMELVTTETQEKVWIGEEKIEKYIEQAGTSW